MSDQQEHEQKYKYNFNVIMHCGGCSGAIERVLRKLKGVNYYNVSLAEQTVSVEPKDSKELSYKDVLEKIKMTGKTVESGTEDEEPRSVKIEEGKLVPLATPLDTAEEAEESTPVEDKEQDKESQPPEDKGQAEKSKPVEDKEQDKRSQPLEDKGQAEESKPVEDKGQAEKSQPVGSGEQAVNSTKDTQE